MLSTNLIYPQDFSFENRVTAALAATTSPKKQSGFAILNERFYQPIGCTPVSFQHLQELALELTSHRTSLMSDYSNPKIDCTKQIDTGVVTINQHLKKLDSLKLQALKKQHLLPRHISDIDQVIVTEGWNFAVEKRLHITTLGRKYCQKKQV